MKYIKKILFIMLLFSLTGCTVDYTLDIGETKKVNEIISLDYSGIKFNSNDLNDMIVAYKTSDLYKKYYVTNTGNTNYKGNYIYNSLDDLKENSDYAKNIVYEEKNNNLIMDFTADLSDYFLPGEDASVSLINEINFNINSPFKVKECNGTKTSKTSCAWKFDEDKYTQDIMIKYDTSSINSDNKYIFIGLIAVIGVGIFILIKFINKSKEVNRI